MARRLGRISFLKLGLVGVLLTGTIWLARRVNQTPILSQPWSGSAAIQLNSADRVLVLAPHPDDEVLGAGGVIQEALKKGAAVRVVFLTNGDCYWTSFALYRKRPTLPPKEALHMGDLRHDEAIVAARILGLSDHDVIFLGYPDQGIFHILRSHWGDALPFRSRLTKVTAVPYSYALHPGVAYRGENVLADLTQVIREFKPTKVFVSHPCDFHPDHHGLYLFTRIALWDLASEMQPELYPYLVHFVGWPRPLGLHDAVDYQPPQTLESTMHWQMFPVEADERARKQAALVAHHTQYNYSGHFLSAFVKAQEAFSQWPSTILAPVVYPATEATVQDVTDWTQATWSGRETRRISYEPGTLVITIDFSRPLMKAIEGNVYVFGYRKGVPFAKLPKLHVRFGPLNQTVSDGETPFSPTLVRVLKTNRQRIFRIPLEALGSPEKVLISVQTRLGDVPQDSVSWRAYDLPEEKRQQP